MSSSVMLTLTYEVEVCYHTDPTVDEPIPDDVSVQTPIPPVDMQAGLRLHALDEFYAQFQAGKVPV